MSTLAVGLALGRRGRSGGAAWLVAGGAGVALAAGLVGLLLLAALVGIPPSSGGGAGALRTDAVPAALAPDFAAAGRLCPAVSPALLAAQAKAESGFDASAVSPAGAVGLAQFMPGTWAIWGGDANGDGRADPRDPVDAIYAQARYDCALATDLGGLHGDITSLMLAAYNAGPYAVVEAGGIPPITETRNYVAAILASERKMSAPQVLTDAAAGPVAGRAIGFAQDRIGTPYEWGGDGADGRFDCSGLTQAAFRSAGVELPRTAAEQWWTGGHPASGSEQPGDLVFFGGTPDSISHVGIVVGNGLMVDAPHTGAVVRIEPYNNWGDLYGFTRVTS